MKSFTRLCALLVPGAAIGAQAYWRLRRKYGVARVTGSSMAPALAAGDRVLYRRTGRPPTRGVLLIIDVGRLEAAVAAVSGASARGPALMVKRLIARAGDPLPAGVPCACRYVCPSRLIVRGDAPQSFDSRAWGCIPDNVVTGIVLRRGPGSSPE